MKIEIKLLCLIILINFTLCVKSFSRNYVTTLTSEKQIKEYKNSLPDCLKYECFYGKFNEIDIRIPKPYIFGPLVYQGQNHGGFDIDPKNIKKSSNIDNFGILLRSDTLLPIMNEVDKDIWIKSPNYKSHFILISIESKNHFPPDNYEKNIFSYCLNIKNENNIFPDLNTISCQREKDATVFGKGDITYYINKSSGTYAQCIARRSEVMPFDLMRDCSMSFPLGKLKGSATVYLDFNQLENWISIEKSISIILQKILKINGVL